MKKLVLCVILMLIFINVNGQLPTFYKIDYTGSASGNYINADQIMTIDGYGGNVQWFEISFWEPRSFGSVLDHNRQIVSNYYVYPSTDDISSDGYRKTYLYNNINKLTFIHRLSIWADTYVDLGQGFYYTDTYPVSGVPYEYLAATDSIQADHWSIESMALNLTTNISDNKIYDAVTEIAKFIKSEVKYKTGGGTLQDAVSVLNSFEGDCRGQSNLMVAMLRSLGIPAVVAEGYMLGEHYNLPLPPGNDPIAMGGSQGPHGIYEVYYPSVDKWVQSDPQTFLHFNDQNFIKTNANTDESMAHVSMRYYCGPGIYCGREETYDSDFGSTTNNYQYKDHSVFYGNNLEDGNTLISAYKYEFTTGIGDKITIEDPPSRRSSWVSGWRTTVSVSTRCGS